MMTRETKVGLMMVALLVGVFGFLLYKRIHQPLEGLATQESSEVSTAGENDPADQNAVIPQREEFDSLTFEKPRARKNDRKDVVKPPLSGEFASKLSEEGVEFSGQLAEQNVVQKKMKLPEIARSDEDGFDQFVERPAPNKKSVPRGPQIEPADDAFDEFSSGKSNGTHTITQVAASSDSEPFSEEKSESEASEPETPFSEADAPLGSLAAPGALEHQIDATESQFESTEQAVPLNLKQPRRVESPSSDSDSFGERRTFDSKSNGKQRSAAVQQTSDFENGLVPAPREKRRPAPVTFVDRSFSPEGSPRTSLNGPSYVIEPNDSFWSISQKRYGAGRYFLALARHNEQVIPDPKRMKPGVAISTPDAAVLEKRYGDLISKPAAANPAPAVVTTQSRKTENTGPAGFFVSTDGKPMYRITGQDTLSEIAKSHLGRSSRWVQILEMNRNVLRDGNELKIGTVLRLPADASAVQVVGTPREFR